ncbi:elongation factor P hydroxylase [Nitrincola iocasae]|uniref:Elongation factor P hydroxylase n=1 Tax=Nitrincola iocasae TaxID=2614693 RepID=A0A5J6LC67_9GAMM|nr:elongation factor P hydroxylase [Nitrincola iocasae]QEW06070.1 elongation factor P hydroxylase [Nitrincola iocasae]
MSEHDYQDLIRIFNQCFEADYNTRLVRGDDEPIYLPADAERTYHAIYFAHGFYSSGLHEIAHWLIAGPQRRFLEDFGYWYEPDGRSAAQQAEFERVEVKPQATEWILADAAGFRFRVSSDNLNGEVTDNSAFKQAVYEQVGAYIQQGLPERTACLRDALCHFYKTPINLCYSRFDLTTL